MNEKDFIEMTVPAKPEFIGVVRLTSSGIAQRLGFSYDEIEDIKVAISEACTNAVHHAYQQESEGKMAVAFGVYDDRLEMMVADSGKSFDLDAIHQEVGPFRKDTPVEKLSEGGLGIFLIETLMDKVEISGNAGVMVLMTKYVQGDGVEADANRVSASQHQ